MTTTEFLKSISGAGSYERAILAAKYGTFTGTTWRPGKVHKADAISYIKQARANIEKLGKNVPTFQKFAHQVKKQITSVTVAKDTLHFVYATVPVLTYRVTTTKGEYKMVIPADCSIIFPVDPVPYGWDTL
jgi:hypothetical protein